MKIKRIDYYEIHQIHECLDIISIRVYLLLQTFAFSVISSSNFSHLEHVGKFAINFYSSTDSFHSKQNQISICAMLFLFLYNIHWFERVFNGRQIN